MAKSDKIGVIGLELVASIGITEAERKVPQPIVVDFLIYKPIRPVALTDRIEIAVNYSNVCRDIEIVTGQRQYHLIETLAEAISDNILSNYETEGVEVTVKKPHALKKAEYSMAFVQRGVK